MIDDYFSPADMTQKKKRTYFCVVDDELYIMGQYDETFISQDKAEMEMECEHLRKRHPERTYKVLRVTLTASPAGWK